MVMEADEHPCSNCGTTERPVGLWTDLVSHTQAHLCGSCGALMHIPVSTNCIQREPVERFNQTCSPLCDRPLYDQVMKDEYVDPWPRAVVCKRGPNSFDAEVMFRKTQRLVSAGHTTREEAQNAANKVAEEIKAEMDKAAAIVLNRYPRAHP